MLYFFKKRGHKQSPAITTCAKLSEKGLVTINSNKTHISQGIWNDYSSGLPKEFFYN